MGYSSCCPQGEIIHQIISEPDIHPTYYQNETHIQILQLAHEHQDRACEVSSPSRNSLHRTSSGRDMLLDEVLDSSALTMGQKEELLDKMRRRRVATLDFTGG